MKISIGASSRERAERLFLDLGCATRPGPPQATMFGFDDGGSVGVFWVDDAAALTEAQHEASTWLEFLVDDVAATCRKLDDSGVERITSASTGHPYYRIPGGPVFRLA